MNKKESAVINHAFKEVARQRQLAAAEKALYESEASYRALVDAAPDSVIVTDLAGNITKISDRTLEFHGVQNADQIIGKNVLDLIASRDRERASANMDKTLEQGVVRNVEYAFVRMAGTEFSGELSASVVRDAGGLPNGFIATVRDVSAKKDAERKLWEKEAQFRDLFENANDLIQAVKPDASFLYVNRAWRETLGYEVEEVKGLWVFDIIHPDSQQHCREMFKRVIAGEDVRYVEAAFISKNGKRIDVEGSISCRFEDGKPVSTRGIFRNTTERKYIEEEKQALENQLHQMQKLEAIGQLAGGVAHDFNNILVGIAGYADLIKSRLPHDPELNRYAQQIIDSAMRGGDLNKKLLAFARKGQYDRQVVSLHQLVQETVDMLQHVVDKRIKIFTDFQALEDFVVGDPSQLQNTILNLGVNARDAMPKGGELRFETHMVEVDESYCRMQPFECRPGRYLVLCVSDTGTGMDSQTQKRVFEPFFTTKDMGKGTGLGLATVYGCLKRMGGFVHVYSELGHGSVFRLYFPPAPGKSTVGKRAQDYGKVQGSGAILLVDDEDAVREIAFEILSGLGYDVFCCRDGLEAVEYFRKHHSQLDLVVLDMIMPNISGFDCFLELRRTNPLVPVLMSTGFTTNEEAQEITRLGGAGLLTKPYNANDLSKRVATAIKKPDNRPCNGVRPSK